MKFLRLALVLLLFSTGHSDARLRLHAGGASSPTWKQVKIGAGGFVTAMQIAPDGTRLARTDTSGAYVWMPSTSTWNLINTKPGMPVADATIACASGGYSIAIAPNLTTRFYMYTGNPVGTCYGYIFRSDNSGATWTRTGFSSVLANPNDQGQPNSRLNAFYMAVDPNNADIVFASTPSNGLWKTTNGGTTWAQVTAVGTATTPSGAAQGLGHIIAYDPASSIVGTSCGTPGNCVTQTLYESTYGTGVYKTTTGGPTGSGWTLLNSSGMPTTHLAMQIDKSSGVVWFLNNDVPGAGSVLQYNGAWSTKLASGASLYTGIATDPNTTGHMYAVTIDGKLNFTLDGGSTFVGPTAVARSSPQIPWISAAGAASEAFSQIVFDPSIANTLYNSSGVGVWKTNPPTTNTTVTWTTETAGIENLAANYVMSVPSGGPIIMSAYDRAWWVVTDPTTYQSAYFPIMAGIDPGWSATDYATNSPATIWNSSSTSGLYKSTDSGATWNASGNPACFNSCVGGNFAAATTTNAVWLVSDDFGPYYTTNGGTSWTACTITSGSGSGGGWHHAQYLSRVNLAVDRVATTTYYLYNDGTGTNTEGVYKSTDGITFARQATSTGELNGTNTAGAFHMFAVPGNSGHLFAAAGPDPHGTLPNTGLFYRSIDGGANWTSMPNVKSVFLFNYGKAKPAGSGYPTIFLLGWVDLQDGHGYNYGYFRSDNANLGSSMTWTNISDGYPMGIFDYPTALAGDYNNFGRVYVSFAGTGYVYLDSN